MLTLASGVVLPATLRTAVPPVSITSPCAPFTGWASTMFPDPVDFSVVFDISVTGTTYVCVAVVVIPVVFNLALPTFTRIADAEISCEGERKSTVDTNWTPIDPVKRIRSEVLATPNATDAAGIGAGPLTEIPVTLVKL